MTTTTTIGERLRQARVSQHLSLTDVAEKANVSVATLSRVETSKQALDLSLFMTLARVLKVAPHLLLGDDTAENESADKALAAKISRMNAAERVKLWRDLAAKRKSERNRRGGAGQDLAHQVEELLAQIEFLREETEIVRARVRRRK